MSEQELGAVGGSISVPKDVYRLTKPELQEFLAKFNIRFRDDDRSADLRIVGADLKAFLKTELTEDRKQILRKLLGGISLTEGELEAHPALKRVEQFVRERQNLYDIPETNEANKHTYEDLSFPRNNSQEDNEGDSQSSDADSDKGSNKEDKTASPLTRHVNQNIQRNREGRKMTKEKLPLISAGTYNGLTSENPNDFLDKYEIAAMSNHWAENTKISLFPAHLAGTALSWFQHYSRGKVIQNWENLKKVFLKTFTPAAQAQTLQSRLENKIQGKCQPVLAYFLEVVTMCRRYDTELSERQIIQYVIQGLKPEICERILNEENGSLEQLEDSLRKIELQLEVRALNRDKYRRVEDSNIHKYEGNANKHELNSMRQEIRQLTEIVQHLDVRRDIGAGAHQPGLNTHRGSSSVEWYSRRPSNTRGAHTAWGPTHDQAVRATPSWGAQGRHGAQRRDDTHPSTTWGAYGAGRGNQGQHGRYQQHNARVFTGGRPDYRGRFCEVCKKNNHSTWECRYKNQRREDTQRRTNKFCTNCKLSNHNDGECFKLHRKGSNQKNV